ncbi:MAG: hypothetical protein WCK35_26075 [Chloroflexota bacterium]
MSSRMLERGIVLWKSDQKEPARLIFKAITRNDPTDETAWIWFIYTIEGNAEKISALESFLQIAPDNKKALITLEKLRALDASPAQVEVSESVASPEAVQPERSEDLPLLEAARQDPRPVYIPSLPKQSKKLVPKFKSKPMLGLPRFFVLAGLICLVCAAYIIYDNFSKLKADYQAEQQARQELAGQYSQLQGKYTTLTTTYDNLDQQYTGLTTRFNDLDQQHTALITRFNDLTSEYTTTVDKFNILSGQFNSLNGDFNNLTNNYNTLNNIAVKPPYIVVHDRVVDTTFYDTDGTLIKWTTPFDSLQSEIEAGNTQRRLIVDLNWDTTRVYTNAGDALNLRNFSSFVTPDIFRKVVPPLYQKSNNAYDYIYRIWYMVGQLSNYASEDLETPRYPLETLLAGGGDCEDLSILFASLIQAGAPSSWYVDLMYVDADHINNPETSNHVIVFIDTGHETFIVETTEDQVMQPYSTGVTGWLASRLKSSSQKIYPEYLR